MTRFITVIILFLLMAAPLFAAGSFSTGILLGVDAKGGSVGKIADDLNYEMRIIKAGDPAAEVNEIPVYYAPSITVNLRYLYDRLMLQLGWEYSATFFYNEEGSVKPTAGSENKIEIEYSRFTFPLSAGLVIPAGKKTRFYLAGGFNVSFVMLEITQSNPGSPAMFANLPEEKNSFSAYIPGFHFKLGTEVLLERNYSLLFEYTRYMSKSADVQSGSGNAEMKLGLDTFEIALGINYTVDTGLYR